MGFFLHLRLIMWKNFTIRRRHKIRCIVDILWPLVLFMMLVALRIVGLKESVPECHFEARALPSAGMTSFLQGLLCTVNNTCHSTSEKATGEGRAGGSLLLRLLRKAEAMEAAGEGARLSEELRVARAQLSALARDLNAQGPSPKNSRERVKLLAIKMRRVLKRVSLDINKDLSLLVARQVQTAQKLREQLRVSEGVAQMLAARRLVCGDEASDGDLLSSHVELQMLLNSSRQGDFAPDPDVSAQCNEHFRAVEQNVSSRILWRWIKPFVRGQILYAPSTERTRRVMGRVDAFFASFLRLQTLIGTWARDILPRANRGFHALADTLKQFDTLQATKMFDKMEEGDQLRQMVQWLALLPKSYSSAQILLSKFHEVLSCFRAQKTVALASEEAAAARGLELAQQQRLWAIVVFEGGDVLSPFATYKIRVNSVQMDDTHFLRAFLHSPGPRMHPFMELKYFTSGFIYIQDLVERSIIQEFLQSELQAGAKAVPKEAVPGYIMQQFPYPCHIKDRFSFAVTRTFPLLMTLSWVYACASLVKAVVMEKEARLAEAQRVAGVGEGALWTAWFLDGFLAGGLSALLLTGLLVGGRVLESSAPSLVLVFLLSYCAASTAFACLLSVFFSRASVAAAVCGMVFVLSYLPYATLDLWGHWDTPAIKYIVGLLSNVAFGFGCLYLSSFELLGVGATWERARRSPYDNDDYSLLASMVAMLVDALLYMLLAWYISNVWPGRHGVPKPLLFPLTRAYWYGVSEPVKSAVSGAISDESLDDEDLAADENGNDELSGSWRWGAPVLEPALPHLVPGIRIRNLTKVFPGGRLVVDRLSLTFYEGHITAFLGHNGAGKTTVISMLTGLLSPTSGTAFIRGLDIRHHMPDIRRSLGVCPQHNVLYDKMTASEHLWLAARLRGRSAQCLRVEVPAMLRDLGMQHMGNTQAVALSGGARRKLCFATAFVGNCRTVILDEPTAGVDPASRRAIWRLLERARLQGRTLVLCTHHLDEAERLGDRVAVLARGRLLCDGSPMFLRRRLGMGYRLVLDVLPPTARPDDRDDQEDDGAATHTKGESSSSGTERGTQKPQHVTQAQIDWLLSVVRSHVPGARLVQQLGCELLVALPYPRRDTYFPDLFNDLLEAQRAGALRAFGVRDSSLEEIFLRLPRDMRCGARTGAKSRNLDEGQQNDYDDSRPAPWCVRMARALRFCWRREYVDARSTDSATSTVGDKAESTGKTGTTFLRPPDPSKFRENQRASLKTGLPAIWGRTSILQLYLRQLRALLLKRFHHTRRSPKVLFSQLGMPPLFITVTLALTQFLPRPGPPPPLYLQPWLYGPPRQTVFEETLLPTPSSAFHGAASAATRPAVPLTDPTASTTGPPMTWNVSSEEMMHSYALGLMHLPGMGTRCTLGTDNKPRDEGCQSLNVKSLESGPEVPMWRSYPECSCRSGAQECPPEAKGPRPPSATVCTGDLLLNLTGVMNISTWIVRNTNLEEERTFGGFTFGFHVNDVAWSVGDSMNRLLTISESSPIPEGNTTSWHETTTPPNVSSSSLPNQSSDSGRNNFIKVWFNNNGWATSAAYLNAINNVVLRALVAEARGARGADAAEVRRGWPPVAAFGIAAVNHPINNFDAHMQDPDYFMMVSNINVVHGLTVLLAMSFVPASFLVLLVEERVSRAKHLQTLCGAGPVVYWLSELVWGLASYLVTTALCVIVFLGFHETAYVTPGYVEFFVALVLFYGWATVPMMFPFSFLFREPSTAFVLMACLNLALGMVTSVTVVLLNLLGSQKLYLIQQQLRTLFLIFPQFCLTQGLIDLVVMYYTTKAQLSLVGPGTRAGLERMGELSLNIWYMFGEGIAFFLITLLIEKWPKDLRRQPYAHRLAAEGGSREAPLDADVQAERERVHSLTPEQEQAHALLLKDLCKEYRRGPLAVDALCLGISPGESFGLLGLNGAGKTTTFKLLTGEARATGGDALVGGVSVRAASVRALRRCGYCPQVDALHAQLSVREHLALYATLRGFRPAGVARVVRESLTGLQLWRCRHLTAGALSGGTRRKLSAALALLGAPPVLLLDEPTAGMDADARRALRARVLEAAARGAGALLTSHALAESEALSTRLSVMAAGRLRCLGSAQHLKARFGRGYLVEVRAPGADAAALAELTARLPGGGGGGGVAAAGAEGGGGGGRGAVRLRERVAAHARFELPTAGADHLATIFAELEKARADALIEDYSVSQSTLEEVFLRFAYEAAAEEAPGFEEDGADGAEYEDDNQTDCDRVWGGKAAGKTSQL